MGVEAARDEESVEVFLTLLLITIHHISVNFFTCFLLVLNRLKGRSLLKLVAGAFKVHHVSLLAQLLEVHGIIPLRLLTDQAPIRVSDTLAPP